MDLYDINYIANIRVYVIAHQLQDHTVALSNKKQSRGRSYFPSTWSVSSYCRLSENF